MRIMPARAGAGSLFGQVPAKSDSLHGLLLPPSPLATHFHSGQTAQNSQKLPYFPAGVECQPSPVAPEALARGAGSVPAAGLSFAAI